MYLTKEQYLENLKNEVRKDWGPDKEGRHWIDWGYTPEETNELFRRLDAATTICQIGHLINTVDETGDAWPWILADAAVGRGVTNEPDERAKWDAVG